MESGPMLDMGVKGMLLIQLNIVEFEDYNMSIQTNFICTQTDQWHKLYFSSLKNNQNSYEIQDTNIELLQIRKQNYLPSKKYK